MDTTTFTNLAIKSNEPITILESSFKLPQIGRDEPITHPI
jgi:hypothetical protein